MFEKVLFRPGMFGSAFFRIPVLFTTSRDTVLAVIDDRAELINDSPNHINKVLRRSFDSGDTWTEMEYAVKLPGFGIDGPGAIDTAVFEDEQNNRIWMFYTLCPSHVGSENAVAGTGHDAVGRLILTDAKKKKYYLEDGNVFKEDGSPTDCTVSGQGYIFENGKEKGHIYLSDSKFGVLPTCYLQAVCSDDEGETWSDPIDLTAQVKEDWMRCFCVGPGIGLQAKHERYRGRLLVPLYFSNKNGVLSCAVIYSDDNGKTWKRSKSPNDGRVFAGKTIDVQTVDTPLAELNEAQIIELSNGDFALYMRAHPNLGSISIAISKDGCESFGKVVQSDVLISPSCMSSILKHPQDPGIWLWSNPVHESKRINGKVLLSRDEGKTWEMVKTIEEGSFSYSCLSVLPSGELGIFWEGDGSKRMAFTKFPLNL